MIAVFSPRCVTGGAEALHQLAAALTSIGYKAGIAYYEPGAGGTPEYQHYGNIVVDEDYQWAVVSAIHRIPILQKEGKRVAFWHLGVGTWPTDEPDLHLACGDLAVAWCKKHGVDPVPVSDYIGRDFTSALPAGAARDEVVVYGWRSADKVAAIAAHAPEIRFSLVSRMSYSEVATALRRASVFLEAGGSGGRDRTPREAALSGAVVVWLKTDPQFAVPPQDRTGSFKECAARLRQVLKDRERAFEAQGRYRSWVRGAAGRFRAEVAALAGKFDEKKPRSRRRRAATPMPVEATARASRAVRVAAASWESIPWARPSRAITDEEVKALLARWHEGLAPHALRGRRAGALPRCGQVVRCQENETRYFHDTVDDAILDEGIVVADAVVSARAAFVDANANPSRHYAAFIAANAVNDEINRAAAAAAAAFERAWPYQVKWYVHPSYVLWRMMRWQLVGLPGANPWEALVDLMRLGCVPLGYAKLSGEESAFMVCVPPVF